jgi:hypothetical protein
LNRVKEDLIITPTFYKKLLVMGSKFFVTPAFLSRLGGLAEFGIGMGSGNPNPERCLVTSEAALTLSFRFRSVGFDPMA